MSWLIVGIAPLSHLFGRPGEGHRHLTGKARRLGTSHPAGPGAHGLGLPEFPEAAPLATSACKRRLPGSASRVGQRGRNLVSGLWGVKRGADILGTSNAPPRSALGMVEFELGRHWFPR